MNRIDECFSRNGKKLISYTVAGYPDHECCLDIIDSILTNGSDIIELGIPFSDPVADGQIIQKASARSIKNGFFVQRAFDTVSQIRKKYENPLLFMLYFNTIYHFGIESFIQKCKKIGVDGLIIPDLPFEDHIEVKAFTAQLGINVVSMISPTSKSRAGMIAAEADNFIYCISSLGVTGKKEGFAQDINTLPSLLKNYTDKKMAIGFGINSPTRAQHFSEYYDAVIIGSALIEIIEGSDKKNSPAKAGEFIAEIKNAIV